MKKNGRPDAMTTLSFEGAGGCAEILVERAVVLRIAGGALFAGGPVIATHADGAWHVGDQRLERIAVRGPVRVQLEGAAGTRVFGPFAEFSLAGDVALAGGRVFARYRAADRRWDLARDEPAAQATAMPADPALSAG